MGGATWQTRRADIIARSIRRAERREQGLLSLNAEVATIPAAIEPQYREAEGHAGAARPYQEAL